MCGIVGVLKLRADAEWGMTPALAERMVQTLRFRGPDGHGDWWSPDDRCWFGHTRLAIIDLKNGREPMPNETGTVWASYNGEIYNHLDIRRELEPLGHRFATRCDAEVLPHGYEQWGGPGLLERLRGMFAFAVYDLERQRLFLARDRLGIKPLYWARTDDLFLFASEIKAILLHPAFARRTVDRTVLAPFLSTRYAPAPRTMFEGIHKLPLAHFVSIDLRAPGRPAVEPKRYWEVSYAHDDVPTFDAAVERADALLRESVSLRLMSDVPLGAQLSGGVDSSLIVAHMARLRRERGETEPINTYSVGFDVQRFSELPYAMQIASRYDTRHHEITVGAADFLEAFARLAWHYDEPIGEPPAIPTYIMCEEAKKKITVMLTGEGGDESFGGYSKYAFDQFSRYLDWMPAAARTPLLRTAAHLIPFRGRRVRSILEILSLPDIASRYASWYGAFDTETVDDLLDPRFRSFAEEHPIAERVHAELARCDSRDPLDLLLFGDIHLRLADNLLVKGDRMAMAAGVEGRVPFLDHRFVEFAASLPPHYKVRGLKTKLVLKKLAERYAPHDLIYRRKVGFTVPLTVWFRGPLRGFVRGLLLDDRCLGRGYYRPEKVRAIVDGHLDGRIDREQGIWSMLAIEMWHRLFIDDDGSEEAAARLRADVLALAGLPDEGVRPRVLAHSA